MQVRLAVCVTDYFVFSRKANEKSYKNWKPGKRSERATAAQTTHAFLFGFFLPPLLFSLYSSVLASIHFLTGKHSCRHLACSLLLFSLAFANRLRSFWGPAKTFASPLHQRKRAERYEKASVVYFAISSAQKVVELVNMSLSLRFSLPSRSQQRKQKGPAINYSESGHLSFFF